MKIDVNILKQLANYGVQPLQAIPQVVLAINAGAAEQAPPEAESILTKAGYTWVEDALAYKQGEQLVFYIALQQPFFIWIWKKTLFRGFENSQKLSKWVLGDDKYPEGKGNKFMSLYSNAIGVDDMDRNKGGDITFTNTASRPDDHQLKKIDPTDALIAKLTKQAGPSKKLPADVMIDVGLKAKEEKNNKLLNFLKTMTPIKEGKLKKSQLEKLIKEIVRSILSEGLVDPIRKNDSSAFRYASQVWGKNNWRIGDSRKTKYGTVYKMVINTPVSRFLWLTSHGEWKALDPKTKKWNIIQSVSEMSGTAAAAPISAPFAFKKKTNEEDENLSTSTYHANEWATEKSADEIKAEIARLESMWNSKIQHPFPRNADYAYKRILALKNILAQKEKELNEMTTTGDVAGYNIPGAFAKKGGSQKGIEGSAALGYTLTPNGEKEMQRRADKLIENT